MRYYLRIAINGRIREIDNATIDQIQSWFIDQLIPDFRFYQINDFKVTGFGEWEEQ